MALIKQNLQNQIFSLLDDLSKRTENQAASNQYFAEQLATLIDSYVKSATVTVTTACGSGAGTGTGTLS